MFMAGIHSYSAATEQKKQKWIHQENAIEPPISNKKLVTFEDI